MKTEREIYWLFQDYITKNRIDGGVKGLADMSGIKYATLNKRIEHPELFRSYEIKALDEILHFETRDILRLVNIERV